VSFNECKNLLNKYDVTNSYQTNFLNFVYVKISGNTKNRFVDKTNDSVDILLLNHPCIKVIPIFKHIDKRNLSLDIEMEKAIKIINNSKFKYVYFVFPKNENFDKHIEIKLKKLESYSDCMVKIIPYSLNDLNLKIT
jgi:hypothetical protein